MLIGCGALWVSQSLGSQLRFAQGQLAYGQPLQLAFASFPGSFVEGTERGRPAGFFLRIAPAMSCIRSGDQMIIRKIKFNIGAAPFLICFRSTIQSSDGLLRRLISERIIVHLC